MLAVLRHLDLFSGYGGFSLGLKLSGLHTRTVGYVEIEPYCQNILRARIRDGMLDWAPIVTDIRVTDFRPMAGLVDIISAGFPCQPHSQAGLRLGEADERNLWPDTLRAISEIRPRIALLENVPGILSGDGQRPAYGGQVVGELAELGYDCRWGVVGARDAGAPHKRDRWWCLGVGDADNEGLEGWQRPITSGAYERAPWPPGPSDRDEWASVLAERPELAPALTKEAESQFRGVADGSPHRVDRLKALGNGIVPAVVAEFLRRTL